MTGFISSIGTIGALFLGMYSSFAEFAPISMFEPPSQLPAFLITCPAGYERIIGTNDCTEIVNTSTPINSTLLVQKSEKSSYIDAILFMAGIGVIGYSFYDWRNEIWGGLRRAAQAASRK